MLIWPVLQDFKGLARVRQIGKQIVARQKGVYGLMGDDLFANLAKVRQDFQRLARVCQIGKQIVARPF